MMRRPSRGVILVGLIALMGLLPACAPATPTSALSARAGATGEGDAVHTLVQVQGQLSVKRAGWTQYAPALFGMALRQGDLLRLEAASQAMLACADLTLAAVQSGIGGIPCKVAKPVLTYAGSLVNPTRGDVSGEFPMVISPRKTKLLNPRPSLRWTPVTGVTTYKVSLRGPNVDWSMDVHAATEIAYPEDAPALAAGATYKLTVMAGERSSDEESAPGLGFTLLSADEANAVHQAEEKIRELKLPDASARFLTANLYAAQGLYAEAIEQLEALAATVREPAVARTLGDLYLRIGVNGRAEEGYLQALELSQQANDIEGQAWEQKALGLIYEARGNPGEATAHLQKALELYQTLGDSMTVKEIQERLSEWPKP